MGEMGTPAPDRQLLWTIQSEAAYREFENTGILRANDNFLFCEDDFLFAYDWISQQMRQRIGEPPESVRYPIWAWYQWEGKRKRRDLRCSGYAMRGTPMVQITFEAAPSTFLLSDFDKWHNILAMQYVARDERDWEHFYAANPKPQQPDVEPSWNRIFALDQYTPDWDSDPDRQCIQATLWQIEAAQVKKVEHFIAR